MLGLLLAVHSAGAGSTTEEHPHLLATIPRHPETSAALVHDHQKQELLALIPAARHFSGHVDSLHTDPANPNRLLMDYDHVHPDGHGRLRFSYDITLRPEYQSIVKSDIKRIKCSGFRTGGDTIELSFSARKVVRPGTLLSFLDHWGCSNHPDSQQVMINVTQIKVNKPGSEFDLVLQVQHIPLHVMYERGSIDYHFDPYAKPKREPGAGLLAWEFEVDKDVSLL